MQQPQGWGPQRQPPPFPPQAPPYPPQPPPGYGPQPPYPPPGYGPPGYGPPGYGPPGYGPPPKKRGGGLIVTIVLVLLAAAGGGGYLWYEYTRPVGAPAISQEPPAECAVLAEVMRGVGAPSFQYGHEAGQVGDSDIRSVRCRWSAAAGETIKKREFDVRIEVHYPGDSDPVKKAVLSYRKGIGEASRVFRKLDLGDEAAVIHESEGSGTVLGRKGATVFMVLFYGGDKSFFQVGEDVGKERSVAAAIEVAESVADFAR